MKFDWTEIWEDFGDWWEEEKYQHSRSWKKQQRYIQKLVNKQLKEK